MLSSSSSSQEELPQFVWLQPSMHLHLEKLQLPNWQHPWAPALEGERLIKRVYEALRESRFWNDSALLVTYDEHGGLHDGVRPPDTGVPPPDGHVASNGFKFDRLGIRIPTVLISPLVAKGTVVSKAQGPERTSQFDGVSTIATANRFFNISTTLTDRHKWSATFDFLFANASLRTDCPMSLAALPPVTEESVLFHAQRRLCDSQEAQVRFYCQEAGLASSSCHTHNMTQGEASKFILRPGVPLYLQRVQKGCHGRQ